jgi:hypothetical protein
MGLAARQGFSSGKAARGVMATPNKKAAPEGRLFESTS